ncbi:MAG: 16S rRNA (guanine(527)-N(7))-methyltransferase RsmG [Candidatus Caenarcaniphilales bacterium]|nr:16S rRNA (guanine(527)-N(7))-methyltransferase RsmG [Candidatus Caenarcaniphilales bacterium]
MTENNHLRIEMKNFHPVESWPKAWKELKDSFGLEINKEQKDKLQKFQEFLQEENKKINLTRLDSLPDFLTFHLLDTGSLIPFVQKASLPNKFRYCDLGTGCGVPGLILHILLSNQLEFETYLCDSVSKKTAFLERAISMLGLEEKIKVLTARTEALLQEKKKFHLITARAMAKPPEALKQVLPLLSPGGIYLAQSTTSLKEDSEMLQELQKKKAKILIEEAFVLADKPRVIAGIERAK